MQRSVYEMNFSRSVCTFQRLAVCHRQAFKQYGVAMKAVVSFIDDECGATAIEYTFIVSTIVFAIVPAMLALVTVIKSRMTDISYHLTPHTDRQHFTINKFCDLDQVSHLNQLSHCDSWSNFFD
jgi:Flp pilus assembly pilin Flp